jgi:hypothetical protein
MALQNKLKAFVRFDGSGRVIPSSLILQKSKPKVGNWKEINATECCNGTPTTTTTTTNNGSATTRFGQITNSGNPSTWAWNACNGFGSSIIVYTDTNVSPIPAGTILYSNSSLSTMIPYSNGAISIDGRVYEIQNGATNPLGGTGQNCSGITTTTTTTYSGIFYNAGYSNDGPTAVCNNAGPFSLPLIVDPNACSNGGITLAYGTYSDFGINNGSTIYVNLNNGNVIQLNIFGSSQMSFGCTSCGGTTTTTTTASILNGSYGQTEDTVCATPEGELTFSLRAGGGTFCSAEGIDIISSTGALPSPSMFIYVTYNGQRRRFTMMTSTQATTSELCITC